MTGEDANRILRVFTNNEAGCGKDVCDLAFALAKTAVRRHVATNHNVTTAKEFVDALVETGVRAHVVLFKPPEEPGYNFSAKLSGVSGCRSFSFEKDYLTMWNFSGIGTGRKFTRKSVIGNVAKKDIANNKITVLSVHPSARATRIVKASTAQEKHNATIRNIASRNTTVIGERTGRRESALEALRRAQLWHCGSCAGISGVFSTEKLLNKHLGSRRHIAQAGRNKGTLGDRLIFAMDTAVVGILPSATFQDLADEKPSQIHSEFRLPHGHAERPAKKAKRIAEEQKYMLLDMFDMGDENKGKKMTGEDANRILRAAFGARAAASAETCTGFFSRHSSKRKRAGIEGEVDTKPRKRKKKPSPKSAGSLDCPIMVPSLVSGGPPTVNACAAFKNLEGSSAAAKRKFRSALGGKKSIKALIQHIGIDNTIALVDPMTNLVIEWFRARECACDL